MAGLRLPEAAARSCDSEDYPLVYRLPNCTLTLVVTTEDLRVGQGVRTLWTLRECIQCPDPVTRGEPGGGASETASGVCSKPSPCRRTSPRRDLALP